MGCNTGKHINTVMWPWLLSPTHRPQMQATYDEHFLWGQLYQLTLTGENVIFLCVGLCFCFFSSEASYFLMCLPFHSPKMSFIET